MSVITPFLLDSMPDDLIDYYENLMALLENFQMGEPIDKLTALMNAYVDDYPTEMKEYVDQIINESFYEIIAHHGIILNPDSNLLHTNKLYPFVYGIWTMSNAPMAQETIDIVDSEVSKKIAFCNILKLHIPAYYGPDAIELSDYILDISDSLLDRIYKNALSVQDATVALLEPKITAADIDFERKLRLVKHLSTLKPSPEYISDLVRSGILRIGTPFAPILSICASEIKEHIRDKPQECATCIYMFVVATDVKPNMYVQVTKTIIDRMFKDKVFVIKASEYVDRLAMEQPNEI